MAYEKLMRRQHEGVVSLLKKHGIDFAELSTASDPIPPLHAMLNRRVRKRYR